MTMLDARVDWLACQSCGTLLFQDRFDRLFGVCPECGWHSRMTANERLDLLFDAGSAKPAWLPGAPDDPLRFHDLTPYPARLAKARAQTGLSDAVLVSHGDIGGHAVVAAAMDFRFLGGSLGVAAGEAVVTAAELALADELPLLLVTASGGARMQEGLFSLLQMSKTVNALSDVAEAGLLTMTLVTDPTFGGVAASFATFSDIIVAEPGARMGFAGPRVIEQTIRQSLPAGFQTAEFLLDHGLVDGVYPRQALRYVLANLLATTRPADAGWGARVVDPVIRCAHQLASRPVAQVIGLARHTGRPTTLDHIRDWTDSFVELHGDRLGADCPAIVGGLALLDGLPVMVIGHQKGHDTKEMARRRFGMPSPAGYRKAARLLRLAGKLRLPVVALVDTPGAHPGLEAEENGQANAISECLRVMGRLSVPVVSVITGEGGSGGALALAVADRVLLCENATYSVISPEGCAAILWRDPASAIQAASALRVDAGSLLRLGLIDGVIPEPDGGAHLDPAGAAGAVRDAVVAALRELRGRSGEELAASRRERFRRIGTTEAMSRVEETV